MDKLTLSFYQGPRGQNKTTGDAGSFMVPHVGMGVLEYDQRNRICLPFYQAIMAVSIPPSRTRQWIFPSGPVAWSKPVTHGPKSCLKSWTNPP